ncbi:M28 family metallopeptidase [Sphingomonas sp. G-3-2-10]|uniref:M28 family metallopeptidase n=1 Tax=Sphingomonas sp. G-3-2-10 TaxID=2728838 RepID=UPI00146DAB78|nr:M28 family metallopeptidase [Sphingomonas sp. G-3-2-10]NML07115.1 M28 family peptidase [Sphingomonas sp. G-3-2-10]
MLRSLFALPLLLVAPLAAAQSIPADQAAIKSHVQFLASDSLRGREAGTRDYDVAAEYVASQMLRYGLKPGGENGTWFQAVNLAFYNPTGKGEVSLTRGKTTEPLVHGKDYLPSPVPSSPEFSVSGNMVFVGWGIVYPEGKRDDYRGLDVRGKIVVMMPGVPKGLPAEVTAHLSDDDQKARIAQSRGARGVLILESAANRKDFAFDAIVPYWEYQRTTWAGPDGKAHDVSPGAPVAAYISQAGADKLFAGSKMKFADVLKAETTGGRMPTGNLVGSISLSTKTRVRTAATRNVIGVLEGADPTLKAEYIVLSAHLDHVGVGDPVNGDRIYNGAMDNAVGTGSILEVAHAFQVSGKRPRRSVMFISLAAEEKGLIGSDYFVNYPTVPKEQLVANINLDMPILTYDVKDLVVQGGERSSIGPVVAQVAKAEGLAVVPDPSPEEMFFVRSDHYSFVKAGIPAVSVDTGPGGEGAVAQKKFLADNYHKPSDQIDLPFNWASAAQFVRINYGVARVLADADKRPSWNKGDFFGVTFEGFGAK